MESTRNSSYFNFSDYESHDYFRFDESSKTHEYNTIDKEIDFSSYRSSEVSSTKFKNNDRNKTESEIVYRSDFYKTAHKDYQENDCYSLDEESLIKLLDTNVRGIFFLFFFIA